MKKFSRGLWIPNDIVSDKRLTAGQKMILAIVKKEKARREDMAEHLGFTMRTIERAFKKFKDLGLLDKVENEQ